ncbi:hypothetical protein [[Kitasatospora] papulosa]|uniref:hypothetical protein n=1 Tax=[Kitasatospora] papulosa TaxID=1464011 RepID=UPI0038577E5F
MSPTPTNLTDEQREARRTRARDLIEARLTETWPAWRRLGRKPNLPLAADIALDSLGDLAAEILVDGTMMRALTIRDGVATLELAEATEMVTIFAAGMRGVLDGHGASNYVEMEMTDGKTGEGFTVTVRRRERPTPHELRQQADARADKLAAELAEARQLLSNTTGQPATAPWPPAGDQRPDHKLYTLLRRTGLTPEAAQQEIDTYTQTILAGQGAPAVDRTPLRDRIRRAVCEAEGFAWDTDMLEPDEYGEHADAVLAVLPAPAVDRATVCICGHTEAQHFEDVCQVCDCGDYMVPEAAREMIAHLRGAALAKQDGRRATTLREGADLIEQALIHSVTPASSERDEVWDQAVRAAATELRNVADGVAAEAQQPTPAEAHQPEHTWAAELHDPLANEWVPGTRYLVRDRAVNALEHARKIAATWKDGTPTERRLVRATTTYTVEQPEPESQQPTPAPAEETAP